MRKSLLLMAFVVSLSIWPRGAAAQHYYAYAPGRFELSIEPQVAQPLLLGAPSGGLQVIAPSQGNSLVFFGLNAGFGVLATAMVEPGFNFDLLVANTGGNTTTTIFAMVPFLKLNLWVNRHVNPFFEPFAGFVLRSAGGSDAFFDGGLYAGIELLPAAWGFRLFTGFEAVVGNGDHTFGIPARWAFVAYF